MKKGFIFLTLVLIILSCNEGAINDDTTTPPKKEVADPNVEKGLALVAKNDCFGCHKVDQTLSGPSYNDVAAKYPVNDEVVDSLAYKIIKGSVGAWGTIPMTPHPSLSEEDARLMVQYILSLKN